MTTQRMDGMMTERERHAKTVTRVEAEAAAKRQLLITDVNNWEHPSAIEDAETCARYILSLAPGKDVVEGARSLADGWHEGIRQELNGPDVDDLANLIAAFATACVAKETEHHRAERERLTREREGWQKRCEIAKRMADRYMPCPDCRDKIEAGDCQRCARQRAESALATVTRERDGALLLANQWQAEAFKFRDRAEAAESALALLKKHTLPPNDIGDDISVELAIELAETQGVLAAERKRVGVLEAALEEIASNTTSLGDALDTACNALRRKLAVLKESGNGDETVRPDQQGEKS